MKRSPVTRILFVCLGNICRSPAAEGVMQSLLQSRGLHPQFLIDSAGTGDWHIGDLPDARMRQAASTRNLSLTSRARQVTPQDFFNFDWIIAMDRKNFIDLQEISQQLPSADHPTPDHDSGSRSARSGLAKLHLFSEFVDPSWPVDVPDPYYGDHDGFGYVLDMLEHGCPHLLQRVQE